MSFTRYIPRIVPNKYTPPLGIFVKRWRGFSAAFVHEDLTALRFSAGIRCSIFGKRRNKASAAKENSERKKAYRFWYAFFVGFVLKIPTIFL